MGPKKYYHHVEREPENIQSIWKVLHTSTFLFIILNSLVSAYIFGEILKSFNYRCILHVEPTFDLTHVTYLNNITQPNNPTIEEETTTTYLVSNDNWTTPDLIDWTKVDSVQNTHMYILNDTFWYKNETMYGKVEVHIRGSDYGSTTSCDLVLFVPLISLIAAAAFGSLILLFGRGQASQRSWIIVYPVLIASAILTILSIIAMVSMKNGIEDFCSYFEEYTGQSKCSNLMSYFTFQGKWTTNEFWNNYNICYCSYILSLFLWAIQLVVTILRLSSLADFHFVTVSVGKPHSSDNEELDEKIHSVLIKSGMKPLNSLFDEEKNTSVDRSDDSTTL